LGWTKALHHERRIDEAHRKVPNPSHGALPSPLLHQKHFGGQANLSLSAGEREEASALRFMAFEFDAWRGIP